VPALDSLTSDACRTLRFGTTKIKRRVFKILTKLFLNAGSGLILVRITQHRDRCARNLENAIDLFAAEQLFYRLHDRNFEILLVITELLQVAYICFEV
jgi:hypothetical protein